MHNNTPEELKPIIVTYKVRNHDIDAYGHVNNAAYLRIVEDALVDTMETLGISLLSLSRDGVSVYMSELAVKYVRPALPGDVLEVATYFPRAHKVKLEWFNIITRTSDRQVLTHVTGKAAFVNREGRVVPIPAALVASLATHGKA